MLVLQFPRGWCCSGEALLHTDRRPEKGNGPRSADKVRDMSDIAATTDAGPGQAWERRTDESAKAFAAFTVYRDLGPARSLERTREEMDRKRSYIHQLEEWSSRFEWVRRAGAFDAEMDAKRRESLKDETIEAARRHAEAAAAALETAIKRLESLDPDEICARDLPNWISTAIKLHRQAIGMEGETSAVRVGSDLIIRFEEIEAEREIEKAEIDMVRGLILTALERHPEAKEEVLRALEAAEKMGR